MSIPTVSKEELEQVRLALRIAQPLEQASPLIQLTLTMIAHCWRGKVPANLWSGEEQARRNKPVRIAAKTSPIDFKRRAAGDHE
jgi:hypothetical protein